MNPCPCSWYGDPVRECTCSNSMVSRYPSNPPLVRRIFGPLLDQTDPRSGRSSIEDRADQRSDDIHTSPPLRGHQPAVQRRRPCTRRGWPGRGARPLPWGRCGQEPAPRGHAAATHERPRLQRTPQEFAASSSWRGPSRTWWARIPLRRPIWPRLSSTGRDGKPDLLIIQPFWGIMTDKRLRR